MDKPKCILVVEDERIVAIDIQHTLAALGYDMLPPAASGEQAIAIVAERRPDLVLMDIRLEGSLDGIEAATVLRSRFGTPVIYLTAHSDSRTLERARKTEPAGYIQKPFKPGELKTAVEFALYKAEMDRRLRESDRWFSTTLRALGDAVVAVDLSGNITFMNQEAESLIGFSATEAVGRPAREVLALVDDDAKPLVETPLERVLREEKRFDLHEAGLRHAGTGAVRAISDSAAPVLGKGRMLGAVMVFRDVTEQKKLRKQIELADRLAALGTLAAGVAHEINNQLTVVLGNATLIGVHLKAHRSALVESASPVSLKSQRSLDAITEALEDLQSGGTRIGRIVSDLRGFSRPSGPSSARANVVEAVQWAIQTTEREIAPRARLLTKLEQVAAVDADEVRLGQVFVNLLLNAAQAISPGRADDNEICVRTGTDEAGRVVVEVRDTGQGIAEAIRHRVFEPFFSTKRPGAGAGLGLFTCHGIVTSLGGEIAFESDIGRGTLFRVLLPPGRPDEQPPASTAPGWRPSRGRILAVDDEDRILRLIARVLHQHDLVCVQRADEALGLLARGERFDLILSDLIMPAMTGVELYEHVVQRFPMAARRMIFLTGGGTTSRVEDFLASVPNPRLDKPFDVDVLVDLVQARLAELGPWQRDSR